MIAVSSGVEKNSRLISDFIVKNKPLSFGLPYMGSKNKIAAELIRVLPGGNVFVDLFAGGCAMTHAALWSGKYRKVIANDIQRQFPDLFFRSITGHLTAHDRRAVDREEFERMKDHDAAVALLWSFGNAGENYLWNRDLEPVKLAAFNMIMCDDKKERYYWFKKFIQGLREARDELERRKNQRASILDQIWDSKEFLRKELRTALEASGKTQAEVNRHLGTQMAGHYFGKSQWSFPTREEFEKLREILPTLRPFDYYGQHLQSLESLQRLERLQSLESLQRLERLQMLE
ncbi:DNA adenine methylase, partial [uncultured Akkermansia sp.]